MNGASTFVVARSLAWREVIRFLRQPQRMIGAIGTPIVFWVLFGAGFDRSFQIGAHGAGPSFREWHFAGALTLIVMFTAVFTSISIIEDRREGFLQAVLVAPVSPWAIVLGKVMGGTFLAFVQGAMFLTLAPTLRIQAGWLDWLSIGALLILAAMAMTSLGFMFAWRVDSTQGFHSVMNLILMPMWLLSGALFPTPAIGADSHWSQVAMHWTMRLDPLTYAVSGVRQSLLGSASDPAYWTPSMAECWIAMIVFAVVASTIASRSVEVRVQGDLL